MVVTDNKESKAKPNAEGKYACKPLGDYNCKYYREPDIKGKMGQYCIFVNNRGICNCQDAIKETKATMLAAKKAEEESKNGETDKK
jgi:hypothetical protein